MKKTISTMICIAAAALAFTACDDDTEYRLAEAPTVTLSPSSITLSAEGADSYTINYTVSSPGEGASVSASADASWVSVIDTSVSGQVRLSVGENTSDDLRAADLTLTYSYDGGSVTAKAAIVQYGANGPVLSVDPNAVVADTAGGEYSFSYSVENPIEGESVDCSADAGWISGFDYSVWGEVSFTVAGSEEEGLRTATITVSYASLSKEVTVVQDHPGSGDDSGSGGGGDFDGTIDSLVGTYTAGGYAYYDSGVAAYTTWTLTIYKTGDNEVTIDGLTPDSEGYYPGTSAYAAKASLNSAGQLVIPTQYTGYTHTSTGCYIGWTPCTKFETGNGWYYSSSWPDCTVTYDPSTGVWTSDYGMFLALLTTSSLSTAEFYGFFDVTNPGFQFTKDGDLGDGGGSGGGDDGGDVDLSEFVGTYSASGYGRISGGYDDATWDMYITEVDGVAYAYCLTPYAGGLDIASAGVNYWATVKFGTNGEIIIPSQVCPGRVTSGSNTYYFGYTPCVEYSDGSFYYSSTWPDLVYTPTGTGTWESNYGVFAAGCTGYDISTFTSYFGVVAPSIKATKTSSTVPESIRAAAASGRALGVAETFSNLKASSAPASGTVPVTRSLGPLPLGSAKPAK